MRFRSALLAIATTFAASFPTAQAADTPAVPGNCSMPPAMSATVPADMGVPNSQANANCFAWQQFIALNWLADSSTCAADTSQTGASFGLPNNTAPVVWETYKESSEVFQKNARPPSAWCAQQSLPVQLRASIAKRQSTNTSAHGVKSLATFSKSGSNPVLSEYGQAGTPDSWLTAQNGHIALYEMRINQDEFNFIVQNQLYDANKQAGFAQNPGFNLPDGSASFSQYGTIGAIELKASWIELPDAASWPQFKTSKAWVVYPSSPKKPKLVTVGLTGLHIIHKTARSPQFIWATFEHVSNAPSTTDISSNTLLPSYTFYNRNCDPATDHYQCKPNAQINGATPANPYFPQCKPDASGNCTQDPYTAPMQVVRLNPISNNSTDNVAGLNTWVWQNVIKPANPESVFLNYQLVDTLWSNNPTPIDPAATVPLPTGSPQPNPASRTVANTTMETYFQTTKTCLACHQYGAVASTGTNAKNSGLRKRLAALPGTRMKKLLSEMEGSAAPAATSINASANYATDYSFLFGDAQTPVAVAKKTKVKK